MTKLKSLRVMYVKSTCTVFEYE